MQSATFAVVREERVSFHETFIALASFRAFSCVPWFTSSDFLQVPQTGLTTGKFAGRQQRFPIYSGVDPALIAASNARLNPSPVDATHDHAPLHPLAVVVPGRVCDSCG